MNTDHLLDVIKQIRGEYEKGTQGEWAAIADGRDVESGVVHSLVIYPDPNKEGFEYQFCLGHDPDGDGVDPTAANIAASLNALPEMLDAAELHLWLADAMVFPRAANSTRHTVAAMIRPYAKYFNVEME